MSRTPLVLQVLGFGFFTLVAVGCATKTEEPSEGAASADIVQGELSLAFSCKTTANTAVDPRNPSRKVDYPSREFSFNALHIRDRQRIQADYQAPADENDGRVVKVKGYDTPGQFNCRDDASGLACNIETLNENFDIGRSARRIILEGDGDGCEWTTLKLGVPKASGDKVKGKLYWEGTTNCFGADLFPKEHSWEVECTTSALAPAAAPPQP